MDLQIFKQNGWEVRAIEKEGEPWFVAVDVCNSLRHTNTSVALNMLDDDERSKVSLGRQGETNIISESGLYCLVMRSNLEDAKRFRKWVTSEVLPSIRKTCSYSVTTPKNFAEALRLAADQAEQIESLEEQKKLDAPKVEFANTIEGSDDCINIGEFAKLSGKIGRNNLFKLLREEGILMSTNIPYQRFVKSGYFNVTEKETMGGLKTVTLITGKGQLWLSKKLDVWW